jgi:hypothetical protein
MLWGSDQPPGTPGASATRLGGRRPSTRSGDHRADPAVAGGLARPGDHQPRAAWPARAARRRPAHGAVDKAEHWLDQVEAVTVVAHAQHGRLDLVQELTGELPDRLAMLRHPVANPPPYLIRPRLVAVALLATTAPSLPPTRFRAVSPRFQPAWC